MGFVERRPFRHSRINVEGRKCTVLPAESGSACSRGEAPPVRMNGAIFISFYLERVRVIDRKREKKKKKQLLCFRAGGIVQGTADLCALTPTEATYSIIAEIPAVRPRRDTRAELSPESHLSSRRAKHVHLTSCSIWQRDELTHTQTQRMGGGVEKAEEVFHLRSLLSPFVV